MGDLVWLGENAVPRWVHRKFYRPWSRPWRVVKAISDVTYRIQCEEVAPAREKQKTRMIVHFNRLKPHHARPAQLQPTLHDVEEVASQPTGLTVGKHALIETPENSTIDSLAEDLSATENATIISQESDLQLRRPARIRRAPAWTGDFLLGKDIDNTLPSLGRGKGVCNVAMEIRLTSPQDFGVMSTCVVDRVNKSAVLESAVNCRCCCYETSLKRAYLLNVTRITRTATKSLVKTFY